MSAADLQATLDFLAAAGYPTDADGYWSAPQLFDGIRKSMTVSRARQALTDETASDAEFEQRLAALRHSASIDIIDPSLK